ncbi:hypothetical protein Q3Y53_02780 [Synechococcus sp. YX-04-1]|uniref:hypothetical protein n=1 Tax=Synechococcus sp. YX-04-1 TaxID=3062778 RepID=UPI0026E26A71|nr:hypothetical protein [Synechococcus sp. YX-04-1]MDO6351458.1 hypothetical protein [Synechococcus sp. YX-04-1]
MVDAVVGAVIMVVAATSLLLAVEVVEDGFRAAGRYPIKEPEERDLLFDLEASLKSLNRDPSLIEAVKKMREDPEEFERKILNVLPKDFNGLE